MIHPGYRKKSAPAGIYSENSPLNENFPMRENARSDSSGRPLPAFTARDLRSLTAEDLPAILKVENDSHSRPWSESFFREELNNPSSTVNVLWHGDEVLGYICYHIILDELNILNLVTAPRFRRRGVARLLLTAALADGVRQEAGKAFLEVRKSNGAAIFLYHSVGFQSIGYRKRYYSDGEDALVLGCTLGEQHRH